MRPATSDRVADRGCLRSPRACLHRKDCEHHRVYNYEHPVLKIDAEERKLVSIYPWSSLSTGWWTIEKAAPTAAFKPFIGLCPMQVTIFKSSIPPK